MNSPTTSMINIGILVPQGCSLLSYASITAPFLQANRILAQQKYHIELIGGVVNHLEITTDKLIDEQQLAKLNTYDQLIIIAEQPPAHSIPTNFKKALQRYYQQQIGQIIAVQAGLWWLLDSAIFQEDGENCKNGVVHWSTLDDFKENFPKVTLSQHLYQRGQRVSSCAGELATLDLLLNYLKDHEQESVVQQIRDHLCMDRERSGNERQRLPSQSLGGEDLHPKLTMAIDLMENNIEYPLTTEQIAELVYISRRQLERLFKSHLNTMPARHYLKIRLLRAQHLLQASSQSIVQIGLSCGFSSGPHFSSAYKACFQTTPREERSKFLNIR